ncbi:helix-turn-helix domain-containing protein [Tenuibacillus multivorans]|uniref:Transcriptional regulator, contains XRE-family HTH domain n=1 Tax=Tenuibacillus multivorans TaxID=237069 RepID=A0A1H0BQZ1_9BACI|nr:XRE family transcriptional regulator [Tenuibacillus multivorans]GEL77069.1 XRE family transcriptional regulator [Tenuibacillus multivorans]SDN48007.1 Transcriptional regulator, contains XRE-family HTH domain [Tenuibacillus multivorans]
MTINLSLLGEKIKTIRIKQRKTQQQIADDCGISKSLLSKIENGKTSAAMATLSRISDALEVKLSWIIDDQEDKTIEIIKGNNRKGKIEDVDMGYSYERLAKRSKITGIEPMVVYVTPKDITTRQEPYTHTEDEFIYILHGTIDLLYDGETYRMTTHDSAYFDGSNPHFFLPVDNEEAQVLTIYVEK